MSEATSHEYFEELCALAALGQIPAEKFAALSGHIRGCASCQSAFASFSEILHAQFSLADRRHGSGGAWTDAFLSGRKYKQLFLARARQLGLRVSPDPDPRGSFWGWLPSLSLPRISYRQGLVSLGLALLLTVGVLGHRLQQGRTLHRRQATEIAQLSAKTSSLRNENRRLREGLAAFEQKENTFATQLTTARSSYATLLSRYQQLEKELQTAAQAVAAAQILATDKDEKLQQAQETLRAMGAQLQSLRQARAQDASLVAAQQLELDDLSRRLQEQTEILERERRLIVADRDIRELMGARDLHIYDVVDVDSRGKDRRSFGRVFYTEGKSLIFYAFDLKKSKLAPADYSFQAWGQRRGTSGSAVSLGIFYIDNAAQRRWVLKFDDPEVLRHINSVFVTVEPFGGVARPTGEKLLYAYLSKPNHP